MTTPSILVIGGFLGAGKTTLSVNLIQMLWGIGKEAALITNDQSEGLVDSEIAAAGGVSTKEIAGGCFCCRCHEFALALDEIAALQQSDIIVAEAVGSCTDLVATVVEPLRLDLKKPYKIFPVVIIIDPIRAEEALIGQGRGISILHDDITYIFLKQLEEAQIILVNKADTISSARMARIVDAITARCPDAEVRPFSANRKSDLKQFWSYIQNTDARHRAIQVIDYDRYARGEASLGWLNAEMHIESSESACTADELSESFGNEIRTRQVENGAEIAHLKVSVLTKHQKLETGVIPEVSVVQCVSSLAMVNRVRSADGPVSNSRVLVNLRAQADAKTLERDVKDMFRRVTDRFGLRAEIIRLDAFAPAAPNPPYQRR